MEGVFAVNWRQSFKSPLPFRGEGWVRGSGQNFQIGHNCPSPFRRFAAPSLSPKGARGLPLMHGLQYQTGHQPLRPVLMAVARPFDAAERRVGTADHASVDA